MVLPSFVRIPFFMFFVNSMSGSVLSRSRRARRARYFCSMNGWCVGVNLPNAEEAMMSANLSAAAFASARAAVVLLEADGAAGVGL